MVQQPEPHFTLWQVGSQQIHVAFDGGRIVSDTGLLAVRALERPSGVRANYSSVVRGAIRRPKQRLRPESR